MKTKTILLIAIGMVVMTSIFHSCKKQDTQLVAPVNSSTAVKKAVEQFQQSFSTAKKSQKMFANLVAKADYGTSAVITLEANAKVYLVEIAQHAGTNRNAYLAISQTATGYSFNGVYDALSITAIETLFKNKVLSAHYEGHMRVQGKSAPDMKTLPDDVKQLSIKELPKKQKAGISVNSTSHSAGDKRMNFYDYGEDCEEWWLCYYDYDTGEWIPYEYLFTECPDDEDEGGEEIQSDVYMGESVAANDDEGGPNPEGSSYVPISYSGHARAYGNYYYGTNEVYVSTVEVWNTMFAPVVSAFTDSYGYEGVRTLVRSYDLNNYEILIPRSNVYVHWYCAITAVHVREGGLGSFSVPYTNSMGKVFKIGK